MVKFKILDTELELDMFDADVADQMEHTILDTQEKIDSFLKTTDGLKNSEFIKGVCHIVFECFNGLFGVGTDKKIFGEKTNLLICMDALGQLSQNIIDKQEKECNKVIQKYLPNRQAQNIKQ